MLVRAIFTRGQAMQNLNNVNHNQSASGDRVVNNNSTENLFDRFNRIEDKGQQAKFASVLSGLKSKFGSAFGGENKAGLKTFDNIMASNKQAVDEFNSLKNDKLDEEEDRKKSDNKKAQHLKDVQDFNIEAHELQAITTMEVAAHKADHDASMQAEQMSKSMRPSDILAASITSSSNKAASSTTNSVNASVANVTSATNSGNANATVNASGNANATVNATATNSASGGATAFNNGLGEGVGFSTSNNSNMGNSSNGSASAAPAGYGLEPMSDSARAAQSMMRVAHVESDVEIEDNLNNINRSNLGSLNSTDPDSDAQNAQKLSNLNNNELRQNLDVLARESNVSKLSLQMTNPQLVAQEKATAKALADMPTSQDKIANLTASKEAQGNLLNTLSGNAQLQAGGQVSSGQNVGGSIATAAATTTISTNSSQRVNAVGTQELSSESLIKSAQAQKQSHGSESLGSRAAIASNGLRASTNKISDQAAANSLNTAKSALSNNATDAAMQDKNATKALNTRTNHALAEQNTANTQAKANNAQEALMRLAQEQLGATKHNSMAELSARNALLADEALNPQNSSSTLSAAISSLKQGAAQSKISTTTNYANSSLYASMFNEEQELDPMSNDSSMDFEQNSDSDEHSAAFAASMQNTTNVAQGNNNVLPQELTQFAPSGNETQDANDIHDKVMQMAARNLKQLSVELSPNELGKMKISISLSEDNEAVSVSLAAANPQTREILAKALPKLRDILASQNITTEAQVSDINSDEPEAVLTANTQEQVALSSITKSAAAKRDQVNVAPNQMDEVSFDSLVASSKSLSAQDRQDLSAIGSVNMDDYASENLSLASAQETLAAFSKGRA